MFSLTFPVPFREWPKPVLLKNMDEDVLNLGLPVWDPRVSPCYFKQDDNYGHSNTHLTILDQPG